MTSAMIAAADLAVYLRIVRRFTDADDYSPLRCIRLEAAGGKLTITGSNRFVLGHARITAAGELPPTIVDRDWVHVITHALDALPDTPAVVQLRRVSALLPDAPPALEITPGVGPFLLTVPTVRATFPKLDLLFDSHREKPQGLDEPIGLAPALVRPFAKACADLADLGHTAAWHFAGVKNPVRLQVGNTFTGLVMPATLPTSEVALGPVGLPQDAGDTRE
jgi:hypothetical protein